MKRNYYLLLFVIPLIITACQPKADKPAVEAASPTYPYTIKHPDYWDIDTSHANTLVVLNALKSYETMDTVSMKKCFADSVDFKYDGGEFKGTLAQFVKMVVTEGSAMKTDKITMQDWEAVVSKDKKENWVTVWYKQKWTNAKGVADSAELINDMSLKDGKIFKFDEYMRHFKTK